MDLGWIWGGSGVDLEWSGHGRVAKIWCGSGLDPSNIYGRPMEDLWNTCRASIENYMDLEWIWGGSGVDLGWMWGGCGVDLGWMWGGSAADLEWIWSGYGVDL